MPTNCAELIIPLAIPIGMTMRDPQAEVPRLQMKQRSTFSGILIKALTTDIAWYRLYLDAGVSIADVHGGCRRTVS